jgi:uncharacterized membrane protein
VTETYSVLYTGRLKPGVDLEQAVAAFAARFRVHPQRVRGLFETGGEVSIRSGLDRSEALEYRTALDRIGMVVRIDPPVVEEAQAGAAPADPDPGTGESASPLYDPFAPPESDLEDRSAGTFREPRSVPASRGWGWLSEGFSMVFASPANWIVAVVVWTLLGIVLNLIPVINFLAAMITSVFMGGLMLGAHEQHKGGRFAIGYLFAGFSNKFGPLFLVGVLYMVGFLAITLVIVAGVGGVFFATTDLPGAGAPPPETFVSSPMVLIMLLLGFALTIPLVMMYWFAPVLVMVDDVSALSAMGMSFRACLKNLLPFLVYGLAAMVLVIVGAIPLMLGLLVVIPAIVASVYTSYRDIFRY